MHIHKTEKAVLGLTLALLVVFLGALFYSAFGMGVMLQGRNGELDPKLARETPPFDNPGVFQRGEGRYEVVMLGSAWSFTPNEVRVPAGSEVTFQVTSTDVVHGFNVEDTRINMMLLPGQISEVTYTFEEPGEHLIICHEYCGLGHHLMYGKVIVE
jgi:cytochrome c oxidase subunit 2